MSLSICRNATVGVIHISVSYAAWALLLFLIGSIAPTLAESREPGSESETTSLKRTFETHAGRRFECIIWGLRDSEIGLKLNNGVSHWVAIAHISKADREWIETRRSLIVAHLAKSGVVKLTNVMAAQDAMSTQSLRKYLDEEWNGEQVRSDNKFGGFAKQVGIADTDKNALQAWYKALATGLTYDSGSKVISWKVPTANGFQANEATKDMYVQFVLGTLCQKIGVSDVNALRGQVKIEFAASNVVTPPPAVNPKVDPPVIATPVPAVVEPTGEPLVMEAVHDSGGCCSAEVQDACDSCCPMTTSPPTLSLNEECHSSNVSSSTTPLLPECEESTSRCRLFRFRR